ncbi:hypothetical protein EVAR_56545_1 [Eumeta japonica]|uniref:Uncharacterized protein n=1 Tax=Eumeta variegata TaxID=151549 RepID=A0A4C1YYD4_EUMVA|nr:hypothetical protein EVAR_56545_1 [Eumeta japonica]
MNICENFNCLPVTNQKIQFRGQQQTDEQTDRRTDGVGSVIESRGHFFAATEPIPLRIKPIFFCYRVPRPHVNSPGAVGASVCLDGLLSKTCNDRINLIGGQNSSIRDGAINIAVKPLPTSHRLCSEFVDRDVKRS